MKPYAEALFDSPLLGRVHDPCPNPTPQIAETDTLTNETLHLEIAPAAREPEARRSYIRS